MGRWSGHVEFLRQDDEVVLARLATFSGQQNAAGPGSWQGGMTVPGVVPDVFGETLRVRPPDGAESHVLLRNATTSSARGRVAITLSFVDTGPAPF